jgi:D-hydroxyproline dehydrogenase subunit gamma
VAEGTSTGAQRINSGVTRGPKVTIHVDDRPIEAYAGESVAAALLAAGVVRFRSSAERAEPRGPFCLMGVCQECVVLIDARTVTSCQMPVRAGLRITLSGGAAP